MSDHVLPHLWGEGLPSYFVVLEDSQLASAHKAPDVMVISGSFSSFYKFGQRVMRTGHMSAQRQAPQCWESQNFTASAGEAHEHKGSWKEDTDI